MKAQWDENGSRKERKTLWKAIEQKILAELKKENKRAVFYHSRRRVWDYVKVTNEYSLIPLYRRMKVLSSTGGVTTCKIKSGSGIKSRTLESEKAFCMNIDKYEKLTGRLISLYRALHIETSFGDWIKDNEKTSENTMLSSELLIEREKMLKHESLAKGEVDPKWQADLDKFVSNHIGGLTNE